jgi:hypothetical protein
MGRHLLAALLAGGALAVSSAAFAHHSFAMFDAEKVATLEGTVKDFHHQDPALWGLVHW